MTGIYLLGVTAIWIFIVIFLTKIITTKLAGQTWRTLVRVLIFVVLLPLPLADEIIGGKQFEQLCKENSNIQVDRMKAAGKTVYLADLSDVQIKGTWVPIRLQPWRFVDVTTNEPVVSYNILHATGGRLIRALRISEGDVPLTFKDYCEPGGRVYPLQLFKELEVTQVQRSALNIKAQK